MRKKSSPLFTSKGEWSAFSVYPTHRRKGSLGVAIPRALFPHSTSRNRLRRQIREAIRLLWKEKRMFLGANGQRLLLVRVQKKGKAPPFRTIQKEMKVHLSRLDSLIT